MIVELTSEQRAILFKAGIFHLLETLEPGRDGSKEAKVEPIFYNWEIQEPIEITEEGIDSQKDKAEPVDLSLRQIKHFAICLSDYSDFVVFYWERLRATGKSFSENNHYYLWRLANMITPLSKRYKGMIEQKDNPLYWQREVDITGDTSYILEQYLPKDWYKTGEDER